MSFREGWPGSVFFGWLCDGGLGGEPLVEGDVEREELFFPVEGVDHLDVELGVFEGWVIEGADVVEEVAGEGAVSVDDGALEAEVVVVLRDFFVDRRVVDGDGRDGRGHGDFGAADVAYGEEDAVDVVVGGGGDDVVVGGDELDAGVVEGEGGVAVVGEDDADGEEAVLDVGEAEERAVFGIVAGVGGDGDFFVGVGVEGGVLGGGLDGGGLPLFFGVEGDCQEAGGYEERGNLRNWRNLQGSLGLHGQVDYHLG